MGYRFARAPGPAAVAVALLTSLAVVGCGMASSGTPTPPTTASGGDAAQGGGAGGGETATTATPKPTGTPSVLLADGRHPAYLKNVDLASRTIVIDVVQFFTDAQAAKAASEDGQESPPPNDYYIRNDNKRLRTLPVVPTARITVNVLADDETGDATKDLPVDLEKLASYFPTQILPLFWVTVRNDRVNTLEEQFLP